MSETTQENKIDEQKEVNETLEVNSTEEIENKPSKIDLLKQKIENEYNDYNKDKDGFMDKWAKFSLKYLHFIVGAVALSLVLLYMPLNFKFVSQIIGLSVLIFALSLIFITKYYLDNKENDKLKLYMYDCWQNAVFVTIVVNFGLYVFSNNAYNEMLVIIGFAAIATIFIQRGVKRSLLSF